VKGHINFAILGCGKIAHKHAEVITRQLDDAQVVAACDLNVARAEEFASRYGVPAFSSIDQMMAKVGSRIDAVSVATPSGIHAANVLELVDHGCRNIVVEKPMTLRLEDAEDVIEACGASGSRLFVVMQNRCNVPIRSLREAIVQGRFGRLVVGTARVRWCRKQDYYKDDWRGTWHLDGGVFANQACHHLDLLLWLLGDVASVFAYTACQLAEIEAEDTGFAVLRFDNGALGSIEATTATRPRDLEGSISVLGEHGSVEIGGFAADKIRSWDFDPPSASDEIIKRAQCENPPSVYAYAHAAYYRDVVDCIRKDLPASVDGCEGIKSLRLIHAIYQSARTGTEVNLDSFVPTHSPLGQFHEADPEVSAPLITPQSARPVHDEPTVLSSVRAPRLPR